MGVLFLKSFRNFVFIFINYSGLVDGSVVLWNPLEMDKTKQKQFLPQKHSHRVDSLSFSPDGRSLASADEKIASVGGWREIAIFSTEVSNRVKDVCTYWTRVRVDAEFRCNNESTNRREPVSSFTSLFFLLPSIFRIGRPISPVHLAQ